ncbi:helix-turn-helix domain-containing protein [Amycolatopsis sp. RTGN1]|uniref:PucR family transcriptional regulator n=1 Tax=Amycolatopsis ponsaeliensis TaxID=2992142 RepID=UPI00254C3014|nr:helix-turn-helix domain-containing protein [Amycolatopsis sp. RTGN1]
MNSSAGSSLTAADDASAKPAAHSSPALHLWATIPVELAEKLRPLTDLLVQEVQEEIQRAVDAYSRTMDERIRKTLSTAIETAIHQCFDAMNHRPVDRTDWRTIFRRAGELEFMEGRTTEPLQAAVRVGARVVWQHISAEAPSIGIPTESLFVIAEAIFAWVDELSTVAIAGHHEAQARVRGECGAPDVPEAARRQLVRMILSGEPADQEWIRALASAARWPVPDRLLVIAVERLGERDDLRDVLSRREALVDLESATPCVLLSDPGPERGSVKDLLRGRRAAVGPAVSPAEVNRSLLLARRLLGLMQLQGRPAARIAWCQDHLPMLLLLVDPFLTAQLREHTDAAFAGLTPKQRHRMATTLLAWLQSRGTHTEIAAGLDVHPQTFRYRIHQLQELLGDRLADPDARLTLELALRADLLLDPETHPAEAGTQSLTTSSPTRSE